MPTFEVDGPCPDGDFFVVRIEVKGAVTHRLCLIESYASEELAQAAAEHFASDPENAPTE